MKFLIIGANFVNKGAQSMLYITVDELRKRYGECEIYYGTGQKQIVPKEYQFKNIVINAFSLEIATEKIGFYKRNFSYRINPFIKKILGKGNTSFEDIFELEKISKDLDAIIDISGYALGSNWNLKQNKYYLRMIQFADQKKIPIFLMPQSFGPFDYAEESKEMHDLLKKYLPIPKKIFAREKASFDNLTTETTLDNVQLSTDLVLQNKGIDINNILKRGTVVQVPEITTEGNVAIIPNVRNLSYVPEDKMLQFYRHIVEDLLGLGKNVYILMHSQEDHMLCEKIYQSVSKNEKVFFIAEDIDCLSYEKIIIKFDYIVASRYHSIVHAFRNNVPCVAIGWANKYQELLTLTQQEQYLVDVREEKQLEGVLDKIKHLNNEYHIEKDKIAASMKKVQQDNCFDVVEQYLKRGK